MNIPREIGVRLGICSGAIYIIERDTDAKEHFFVVLNHDPVNDEIILLVGATTQHAKEQAYIERAGMRPDTLVRIAANQSKHIRKETTFNCNRFTPLPLNHMAQSLHFKRVENTGNVLESDILEKLRDATLRSPRLVKKHRRLLILDEEA